MTSTRGFGLICVSLMAVIQFTPPPRNASAQTASGSAVLETLEGVWTGRGVLLGRHAEFRMAWEVMDAGFVRLSYQNMWLSEEGTVTPVLSAHASFYVNGSTAVGVWVDDRPQRLTIEVAITDSSFVSHWTADAEEGRTEYLVRSPNTIVVQDYVYTGESERLFAEAIYTR